MEKVIFNLYFSVIIIIKNKYYYIYLINIQTVYLFCHCSGACVNGCVYVLPMLNAQKDLQSFYFQNAFVYLQLAALYVSDVHSNDDTGFIKPLDYYL